MDRLFCAWWKSSWSILMYLFDCCMGLIPRKWIGGPNVYTVGILGTQWRIGLQKETDWQQLGKELLPPLLCQFNKQKSIYVLFFILLITRECEHFQNGYGIYVFFALWVSYSYIFIIEVIIASLLKCKISISFSY